MKNCTLFTLIFFTVLCFGQQKQFKINWDGHKILQTDYTKIEVPAFDTDHFSYDETNGLTFFAQWESNGSLIDESSLNLSSIGYETISASDLKDLNPALIPASPKYKLYNTNARENTGIILC